MYSKVGGKKHNVSKCVCVSTFLHICVQIYVFVCLHVHVRVYDVCLLAQVHICTVWHRQCLKAKS